MPSTTSACATPIKGTVYRMTRLDSCGNPVTGASSLQVSSKGFVQVQMDPQYEDGVEFFERTADGTPCVNQKDDPVLKRMQLTIDFCEINTTGAAWMMSARELAVGATGYGFAVAEGTSSNRYSLEVWQQVAGSGACNASGLQQYIYHAWPNVGSTKINGYTVENGRSMLQLVAETRAASSTAVIGWLDGPGSGTSWLPTGTANQAGGGTGILDHWLWTLTTTTPPTPACNPVTVT
jgi:hypothetical protein